MKTAFLSIEPRLYTIEQAAELLKTDHTRSKFIETHVVKGGLKLTRISGKVRVSSIELTRYILEHTA